jgi:hypothetical protein
LLLCISKLQIVTVFLNATSYTKGFEMKRTRLLNAVNSTREELGADVIKFYSDSRVTYTPRTISGLTMKWYGLRHAYAVARAVNKKITSSGYRAVVTENSSVPGLLSMHVERNTAFGR